MIHVERRYFGYIHHVAPLEEVTAKAIAGAKQEAAQAFFYGEALHRPGQNNLRKPFIHQILEVYIPPARCG